MITQKMNKHQRQQKLAAQSSWKNLYTTEALTFNNISTNLCVLIKYDLGLCEGYKSINS